MSSSTGFRNSVKVVVSPGRPALIGMVQAAALMARADGQVDDTERQGLLRFLRSRDLLQAFGRRAVTEAYQAELASTAPQAEILMQLERLRGYPSAALVTAAAASVAAADGKSHPAELALLQHLQDRLDVAQDSSIGRAA